MANPMANPMANLTNNWKLNTPIALIIFNRPDTTERVFAAIAQAKPPVLLVVADGARTHRAGEAEKCAATRAIVDRVDWDCKVLTNYSETNLGCKKRVASGLDWIFEQVPEAIILEDDCLPDPSFFRFCEEMLERYRDDARIGMVSGTNFLEKPENPSSYFYSMYPHIWGWASWRRVWKNYDVTMQQLDALQKDVNFQQHFSSPAEYQHWVNGFTVVRDGRIDTWDAQVMYLFLKESFKTVYPRVNLISNIGFDANATHTRFEGSALAHLPTRPLDFPLVHPQFMLCDRDYERTRRTIDRIGFGTVRQIFSRAMHYLQWILFRRTSRTVGNKK